MRLEQLNAQRRLALSTAIGLAGAMVFRILLLDFESVDYRVFLSSWYDHFLQVGRWHGLGHLENTNANYAPLYMTLLSLCTWLPVPKLYAIKLLSVVFDFIAAGLVYKIVRQIGGEIPKALRASGAVLFLPTVVMNASLWGQCDMMYTACFLWSLQSVLRGKPAQRLIAFGFAASLKPQAIFWTPFLAGLFCAGRLPWRYLAIPPLIYGVCGVPEILAGRPVLDVMLHWATADHAPGLTLNAPNWYQWVFAQHLQIWSWLGVGVTVLLSACLVIWMWKIGPGRLTESRWLVSLALLSVLFPPFFLPGMHERYFFAADVLSVVYASCVPRGFWVAVFIQVSSAFAYLPFLFNAEPIPLGILPLPILAAIILIFISLFQPSQIRRGYLLKVAWGRRFITFHGLSL